MIDQQDTDQLSAWREIARELRRKIRRDHTTILAAGVSFYSVLGILPALIIAVSVYGIFTSLAEAERQIDAILDVLPESAAKPLESQLRPIADLSHAPLTLGLVASVIGLFWTASNAVRALVRAVVIAYDQGHLRSRLEGRLTAMGLTGATVAGGLVALAVIAALPVWLGRLDPSHALVTFGHLRWLLVAGAMATVSLLLYRYAPQQPPPLARRALPGVAVATVLWSVASLGFSMYVGSFGKYNATYGVLGGAVVLLLWFWLTAVAVILGAQLNRVLDVRRGDAELVDGDPGQQGRLSS